MGRIGLGSSQKPFPSSVNGVSAAVVHPERLPGRVITPKGITGAEYGYLAGIVSKKLSFRDIFTSRELLFLCLIIWALIQREIERKKWTGREDWSRLTTLNQ